MMLHVWGELIHHWRVELLTLKKSTMRKILLFGTRLKPNGKIKEKKGFW
jgi:hypothetical protein